VQVDAYFTSLRTVLRSSIFISSVEIQEDARTSLEGFFKANVHWIDGSLLSFREYVNTSGESVVRYTYSFHYQKGQRLIFRYDNTPHYPNLPTFPHHKHTSDGQVVACTPPILEDVIREIESHLQHLVL